MENFGQDPQHQRPVGAPVDPEAPSRLASHDIDIAPAGVKIDGVPVGEMTVARFTHFLGQPRVVEPALKESDAHGNLPKTRVIWDTSGVMLCTEHDQMEP